MDLGVVWQSQARHLNFLLIELMLRRIKANKQARKTHWNRKRRCQPSCSILVKIISHWKRIFLIFYKSLYPCIVRISFLCPTCKERKKLKVGKRNPEKKTKNPAMTPTPPSPPPPPLPLTHTQTQTKKCSKHPWGKSRQVSIFPYYFCI